MNKSMDEFEMIMAANDYCFKALVAKKQRTVKNY